MSRSRAVSDLGRAVVELAIVWGWHVPPDAERETTDPLPGLVLKSQAMVGPGMGWHDLTIVRGRDRRLIFAALTTDRADTKLSRRKRFVLDVLRSLAWDSTSDEQRQAEHALGHLVPSIEAFVWRPVDLVTGTIDEVLR